MDVYPEPDRIGRQFKYASSRGVRLVTVEGGSERAAGQVTIKNMETGEQTSVSRADVAGWIRRSGRTGP